jgi:hypothetical protein
MDVGSAGDAAQQVVHSTSLRRVAAMGLAGYGLLHLLVGWLTLQLAWRSTGTGSGGASGAGSDNAADVSGALAVMAASPGGRLVLWLVTGGLAGLTLWQAVEVLRNRRRLSGPAADADRRSIGPHLLRSGGTAVVYGYLTMTAARTALTGGQQRSEEQQSVRGVLSWPGGQVLVVLVAIGVVAVAVYQVQKGVRTAFLTELDLDPLSPGLRRLTVTVCRAGFVAKGVALLLVGGLVGWAAVTFDPDQANGLDGALRTVAAAPYGSWLLTAVALGFASFSVYCFARARHPVS